MNKGKLIVIAAPSGSGKTSIVKKLIQDDTLKLRFSISATTRKARKNETNGKDYYFINKNQFKELIEKDELIEWEEVYENQYYGTLFQEVERIRKQNQNVVFDIDVNGALSIKKKFGESCLSIFIKTPNLETLKQRLESRKTEDKETLEKRLNKAKWELSKSTCFDSIFINDDLNQTVDHVKNKIQEFLDQE